MSIHLSDEQPIEVDGLALCGLAERVLKSQGYPENCDVALILVSDEDMAAYNKKFMERSGPTDVLAFPLEKLAAGAAPKADPFGPPLHLGDVIIAPAYVGRQAGEHGTAPDEEISLMVVHGLLHLMGYDHAEEDEAENMEERERQILNQIGMQRR